MKFAITAVLTAAAALAGGTAAAQQVSLNVGHTLAPDSHYMVATNKLAELAALGTSWTSLTQ